MRILLIDDDIDLLEMTIRRVSKRGFTVSSAQNLSQAETKFKELNGDFIAVICDLFLGNGENGVDYYEKLRSLKYPGKFIISTGDEMGDKRISEYKNLDESFFCLQKPFSLDDLIQLINSNSK